MFITQSAVSQRIHSLENHFGKPVLIRSQPYKPTALGELLLSHYKRLLFLEESLKSEMSSATQSPKISIPISRDSLDTWFAEVIVQLGTLSSLNLEIIADDQEVTLDYLKKGLVSACASTASKSITGCHARLIGYFDYILVASPTFIEKYFNNKKKYYR